MSSLLKLLMKLLVAKLDDDADEPDDVVEEATEESDDDADKPDENEEVEGDGEAVVESVQQNKQSAYAKLRVEKKEAERKYQKAMEELEVARRVQPQPVVNHEANREAELRKQEDDILRNPEASDWQKYAVQSARDARSAAQSSQAALREARDFKDIADFSKLESSQPKTFAAYKDKVEKMLTDMRAKGQDAPRQELYKYLVGQDLVNGKLKTSTAKSSASKTGGVNRGSTPGARSDVSSKDSGKLSESEKRAKRLENVRI